ncbi:uncharacterized protein LOC126210181 isoform X2 [Schistocerca nitens]|uniref:uncharacterized protein LOC126210181 isoform X2 n=1 Tax=Schistocerca nitens TaxID=7011 RepID=UPI002118DC47|nr:uncharacterized protein LOC126210181 isoform X2 [Schistocerca nitens]
MLHFPPSNTMSPSQHPHNDPIKFYLHSLRKHAFTLARLRSHILFSQACLTFGITPKGLTLKVPISGWNPSFHQSLYQFQTEQSIALTHLILHLHINSANEHTRQLLSLIKARNLSSPTSTPAVQSILLQANRKLEQHATLHLKKLSNLLVSHLRKGNSLTLHNLSSKPQPPLIAHKPSLSHILNLPLPAPLPPKPQNSNHHNLEPQHPNSVVNLSSKPLSQSETSVLSKGLTFSPTPRFNQTALVKDLLSYTRTLCWKYHFSTKKNDPNPTPNDPTPQDTIQIEPCMEQFRPPSQRDPPPLHQNHPLQTFQEFLTYGLASQSFLKNLNPTPNITTAEAQAIRDPKADRSIVILPADKGYTTVVLDRREYVAEGLRQLSDNTTYKVCQDIWLKDVLWQH